jgi:AcrR family transcriptional regulator
MGSMPYHHGDLRDAILTAAAAAVDRGGPSSLSLRALAREVGVTHTAPRHHFGDKRGVLTALAAQGYRQLAERILDANRAGNFLEAGVAYVEFALQQPAHFQVMFRPDLVDGEDADLRAALDDLYAALSAGVRAFAPSLGGAAGTVGSAGSGATSTRPPHDPGRSLALAAWSLAHGFATLAHSGNFPHDPGQDVSDLARDTLRHLSST